MDESLVSVRQPLIVYGAGGHGLVVAEAAAAAGWRVRGFVDDNPAIRHVEDGEVLDRAILVQEKAIVIIAIGDNATRQRLANQIFDDGHQPATVVHPTSWVSPSAQLGRGVFVGPQAVIHSRSRISDGVIVNSGSIVEHDCVVRAYAHIAPRAAIGASARIGERSLIGLGASVHLGTQIGVSCTVGVGAAVVKDVGDGRTVVGVPAKVLDRPPTSHV